MSTIAWIIAIIVFLVAADGWSKLVDRIQNIEERMKDLNKSFEDNISYLQEEIEDLSKDVERLKRAKITIMRREHKIEY